MKTSNVIYINLKLLYMQQLLYKFVSSNLPMTNFLVDIIGVIRMTYIMLFETLNL